MFTLTHLFIVLLGVTLVHQLVRAIKLQEQVKHAVIARCEREAVQLLDGSVYLRRLRLRRNQGGWLQWYREYQFEFTATGGERNKGSAGLLGRKLLFIELSPHRF